jgi:N-methylhydantoinase A
MLPETEADSARLEELFAPLEQQGRSEMLGEGFDADTIFLERYLDMRYRGQSFEIIVPFERDYVEAFARLHEQKYGYRNQDKPVEVVNVRLRARGTPQKPEFRPAGDHVRKVPEEAWVGRQNVVFDGQTLDSAILDRERLLPGNTIQGPAVIVEYTSTIVVPPYARCEVDGFGNIVMTISG